MIKNPNILIPYHTSLHRRRKNQRQDIKAKLSNSKMVSQYQKEGINNANLHNFLSCIIF
jgi:hypothetical protein